MDGTGPGGIEVSEVMELKRFTSEMTEPDDGFGRMGRKELRILSVSD